MPLPRPARASGPKAVAAVLAAALSAAVEAAVRANAPRRTVAATAAAVVTAFLGGRGLAPADAGGDCGAAPLAAPDGARPRRRRRRAGRAVREKAEKKRGEQEEKEENSMDVDSSPSSPARQLRRRASAHEGLSDGDDVSLLLKLLIERGGSFKELQQGAALLRAAWGEKDEKGEKGDADRRGRRT